MQIVSYTAFRCRRSYETEQLDSRHARAAPDSSTVALPVPRAVSLLVPPPQRCRDKGGVFRVDGRSWSIVVNESVRADAMAATRLQAELARSLHVNLTIVDLATDKFPQASFLAFGDPAVSPALEQLATERNLSGRLASLTGRPEGYVLDTAATSIVGLGSTSSAIFFATVTAAQLINVTANPDPSKYDTYRTPAVTITDWPDVSMRGYTLQGLRGGTSKRPVPSPFFYKQADLLARFKMNLCYAAFEDSILTNPVEHADMILGIVDHCTDLHLLYIPAMSAGAKVGALDGRTGEGVWVRNASFTVGDAGLFTPDVDPFLLAEDFEGAKLSGWDVLSSSNGEFTWKLDKTQHHTGGQSILFDSTVGSPVNGVSSRILSKIALPIEGNRSYQLSVWAAVANFTGCHKPAKGCGFVWAIQLDADGDPIRHLPTGVPVEALMDTSGAKGGPVWKEGTMSFKAEPGATSCVIYAGLLENVTAKFWLDDVTLLSLDHSLSNIIRTNITDVSVIDATSPHVRYKQGVDFEIIDATANVTISPVFCHSNLQPPHTTLAPDLQAAVKAVPRGALDGKATKVLLSYDLQAGSMGHHTYDDYDFLGRKFHCKLPSAGIWFHSFSVPRTRVVLFFSRCIVTRLAQTVIHTCLGHLVMERTSRLSIVQETTRLIVSIIKKGGVVVDDGGMSRLLVESNSEITSTL